MFNRLFTGGHRADSSAIFENGHRVPDKDLSVTMQRGLIGARDDILGRIDEYRACGLQHCMINRIASDTLEEKLEQTQMFAEEVLPVVKAGKR